MERLLGRPDLITGSLESREFFCGWWQKKIEEEVREIQRIREICHTIASVKIEREK